MDEFRSSVWLWYMAVLHDRLTVSNTHTDQTGIFGRFNLQIMRHGLQKAATPFHTRRYGYLTSSLSELLLTQDELTTPSPRHFLLLITKHPSYPARSLGLSVSRHRPEICPSTLPTRYPRYSHLPLSPSIYMTSVGDQ